MHAIWVCDLTRPRRCYPPAHASRACPTCAFFDAKPGQARVSWRGGSAGAAKLRRTGWGGYACSTANGLRLFADSVLAAPPTRLRLSATAGQAPDLSPPRASRAGGGEKKGFARGASERLAA